MKKIKVTEKSGASIEYTNDGEILNRLSQMGHGLPERSVPKNADYDPADVIEEFDQIISPEVPAVMNDAGEIVQAAIPAVTAKFVKLKAEYSVEIVDITAESALADCIKKRIAEYPSAEDYLNALFDGSPSLDELRAKRLAIKAKYPKPTN